MWNDKPDEYLIPARNPTGTGTGMNFYPWIRVQISTRSLFTGGRKIALPDPNPTRCHPYPHSCAVDSISIEIHRCQLVLWMLLRL
jgi:hypothetical protein